MIQGPSPRILVVRGGAIGDFIQTMPAIGALRQQWPEARIEVLGYPHIAELANGGEYADAIRSIEGRAWAGFFAPNATLDPELVRYLGRFNVVVSYLYDPDEVFAENIRRCGVKQLLAGTPRPTQCHAAEHYCAPLQALGIVVKDPRPRVYPAMVDKLWAGEFLSVQDNPRLVAVHPGSGGQRKNWPVEKFVALCRWLTDELALEVLIVRGEADTEPVAQLTAALPGRPWRLVSGLRLGQLAAVLARCALYVGNDSGITHLAAAVRTPTIALFGPASTPLWVPKGPAVRVVWFGDGDGGQVRAAARELLPSP